MTTSSCARCLLIAAALMVSGQALAQPQRAKRRVLVYGGQLQDERGAAIGGVFPLTFALYTKSRGGTPVWSENHFVAVDNGGYTVELGRKKLIPQKFGLDQIYIGVRIRGGPELVREQFVVEGGSPVELVRHKNVGPAGGTPGTTAGRVKTAEFADKAELAFHAEKADDSIRLGGKTLEQLKQLLGGGAGGKLDIGTNTYNAPGVGGQGGTEFTQLCPDGYVMTGLRGGSGLYVDRVSIICSPIKLKAAK